MRARGVIAVVLALLGAGVAAAGEKTAHADVVRAHNDAGATGWYPDQPVLSSVVVDGGQFGQLFSAAVDGQVYAQPLVANDTLLVVTENNKAYGLNPRTGAQKWERTFAPSWRAVDLGCPDLTPNVGITGTPVVDPTTNTEFFTAKTYKSGNSGPAAYVMHAVDVSTGAERAGFPVVISGKAANAPSITFDATYHLQRPGLLLKDGVVYAAFGGHCDHPPYSGWVIGVTTTGQISTRWVAQESGDSGAGIWQAGGALISAGPSRIVLATGNGRLTIAGPTPGSQPPHNLSEAMVRLVVQPDKSLRTVDFFTPYDAPSLDAHDADFGSGGPVALPQSYNGTKLFGTAAHPNLVLAEGKAGFVYLLDRDRLGGYRMGTNGADAAVARIGPYGGVWSTPAVWPGDGGYVYITHGSGPGGIGAGALRVYKYGLDGAGKPTLAFVGRSQDAFGFGSGSPVVTSDGLTPGSALVWVIWQGSADGHGAQLRADDAVPVNGELHLRWSAPIGQATKFAPPAVSGNRVYLGTRDGRVRGFGYPVDLPLTPSPSTVFFPDTIVHHTAMRTVVFAATRTVTVSGFSTSDPAFTLGTPSRSLPATLAKDDLISVPVKFTPTAKALASGALNVALAGGGETAVGLEGIGRLATGDLAVFPRDLSLGGAPLGGSAISGAVTFSNIGGAPLHVTGATRPAPATNFTVSGMPPNGTTIPAGGSVLVTVTFTPRVSGFSVSSVALSTDAPAPGEATADVTLSASAAQPAHLVIVNEHTYFGAVRIGTTTTRTVVLGNKGRTAMTVTKSKPPALGAGFVATSGLSEGTTIGAGNFVAVKVAFTATRAGHFADTWTVNGDDDTGLHTLTFDAYASPPRAAYWLVDTAGRVYPLGDGGALGQPSPTSAIVVALVPTPTGKGYYVLDERGRVYPYGDAVGRGAIAPNALRSSERATTLSVTPSGGGYWVFTSAGRAFRFGDAGNFGDLANKHLNGRIVASVATQSGLGYYMVGADGGVFSFGDATFKGSMGGKHLNRPIVALVPTATGGGYWLAASDGGVFAFGDAPFRGSMGGRHLNAPVCGMVRYGNGYLMVASDGGIFDFSSSPFVGSLGGRALPAPIVGVGAFAV